MDRFVISCGEVSVDALKWFIDIVDSDTMQIIYQENHETNSAITNPKKLYQCGICDLPNIAYSYALALFKLYTLGDSIDEDIKTKSNHAIQAAMNRFPLIVGRILEHLSIDTTGRSFRRDWVTVLEYATELSRKLDIEWSSYSGRESDEQYYDAITLSATMQACERVTKNYVTYCSKFWNDEAILHWMYTNLKELKDLHTTSMPVLPKPPNPAIIRYLEFDASDYDDKITTLPPEVAMIDPGLIAYAMTMNTNRARFARQVQQNRRGGRAGGNDDMDFVEENGRRIMADGGGAGGFGSTVLGPPTNIVDPDWPLVEVFWRSFLPWNHVDGVPPPRR